MFEPWAVATQAGTPYRVFSAFWRACTSQQQPAQPIPAPTGFFGASHRVASDALDSWCLTPTALDWATGLVARWEPGEAAAQRTLDEFLDTRIRQYASRDFPAIDAGSELSPHLRWGEISPRDVWYRALAA